jgi:hypothetical protein
MPKGCATERAPDYIISNSILDNERLPDAFVKADFRQA